MMVLRIRSETSNKAWQVWPAPEALPAGAVQENGRYLFELAGSDEAAAANLAIDGVPLEALRVAVAGTARWRWSPGFHAGTVEADLRIPGSSTRRFEVVTDPDQHKLTREDFDFMVREILEDTFALFSLSSFRRGIARGNGGRPPPLARLEFLRSRIEELEQAVAAIARRPVRRLTATETVLPYHRALRVSGPEVLRSFQSGRIARETGHPSRLPAALRGFLPEQIRVQRRLDSHDLPEHRQMAACLRAWADWMSVIAGIIGRRRREDDQDITLTAAIWAERCRKLSQRLTSLATAGPLAEAGDGPPRLVLSSLFRNNPDYRRFYRLWRDMDLGLSRIFGDFLDMPLARTFELYELWCFLRLVRAGIEEFGTDQGGLGELFTRTTDGGVTIATGAVTVAAGDGWKLLFQKQYREFWTEPDGRGSYSRTMTPDIVVTSDVQAGAGRGRLIVLDAKYRIADGLNDALSSIHTYRDALVREVGSGRTEGIVTAAYLLTPHLPDFQGSYQTTPMPGRLFHPDYRTGFRFGAVTLRPGMALTEITAALRLVIADASGVS